MKEQINPESYHSLPLIIASKNVHKVREYKALLHHFKQFDILSLLDFPEYQPLLETHTNFKDNAIQKATHAATHLKAWVLADDSGLIIPALGDKGPGVFSARYAGENASDADNRKKLIRNMEHLKDAQRSAYFECHIALASFTGLKKHASAICEGTITEKERKGGGFGYDSLFIKLSYSKTFSELEESVKNRISHRGKALDKILIDLEQIAL